MILAGDVGGTKVALALFPLNPALFWVDRQLSLERELACDAGVVTATAAPFDTVTKRVTVTNGTLTLDPTGGTQTKIDFVDIAPATTDTTPPTAAVALAGPQSGGSSSPYTGPVTATITSADNVGVTSTTYSLDGAAAVSI